MPTRRPTRPVAHFLFGSAAGSGTRTQAAQAKWRCIALSGTLNCRVKFGWNKEDAMAWTTPTLVEICIGLEINGYLPAEF